MRRIVSSLNTARALVVFLGVLLFNSLFLAVMSRLPDAPRLFFSAAFHMSNVALHLALGLVACVLVVRLGHAWRRAVKETQGPAKLFGLVSMLACTITLLAGLGLLVFGNLRPQANILAAHGIGAVVCAIAGAFWLTARLRARTDLPERRLLRSSVVLIALFVGPGAALLWYASGQVADAGRIVNPDLTPASMEEEGDGPNGPFWPSSIQKKGDKFFPVEYFTDSQSCGVEGCHPDIYKQWNSSAHRLSSFNNQWYRKSIEYMQEVVGTKPSKWCGGCHDMAVLLTEMPGTGKSRFDFPIKDQIYPPEQHPEAHAGIGCAACHSVVHVKSTMGNGDYVNDYPPMHQFVISKNPLLQAATKFLTRLSPGPHRKTFLKPFHQLDTAKFCSSCHKVHLDQAVNNFRWARGFNDYDAWQASGISGFGARSFYYPKGDDGKPAFKKCANCHMPEVKSNDAGNINGLVHNHAFPGANTALPYVNHDTEQLALVQKFLKDGALSIDIFALRREKAGAGAKVVTRKPKVENPAAPEGQSASLMGDVATTGNAGTIASANTKAVNEEVVAPLNRGAIAVKRGEDALIDVVVRTRKVGHAFPGGTFDAFDVWTELQAKDENGKVLFWSGSLDYPDGPVEKGAHQYRALLVDGHSNPINKRNAWSARTRIYARAIPPGAADTVHYRLRVPKDCGKKITLTAKLNYRKFSHWNTQFSFGGRPENDDPNYSKKGLIEGVGVGYDKGKPKTSGPVTHDYDDRPMKFDADLKVVAAKDTSRIPALPITTLCENTVTIDVTNGDPVKATAPRALDIEKDRERWNDYGIGLMLQGDFQRATKAFHMVTTVAPKWPEGYVNIGRVRLQEGSVDESVKALDQALALYAAKPTPMTPYQKARTQFFFGMALKQRNGDYDGALKVWRECAQTFPQDRELRNQMGRVLFLQRKFKESETEFKQVLAIDPEDLTAHYNLMLVYKGLGDLARSERHRKLYYRFKNDETTTHLAGPYLRQNPEDNNDSLPIHEHGTGPLKPGAAPELAAKPKPVRDARKPAPIKVSRR